MKHTRNFMWGLWMLALGCASIVLVVSGWIGLSEQNHYGAALLILGATALVHYTFDQNRERKRHWWQVMGLVAGILILAVGFAANYGEAYLEESFGNVSFGTMLYHMNTDLTGTNLSTFSQVFITLAVILAVTAIAAVVLDLILRKLGRHRGFSWFLICLGIVLTCHAGDRLYVHFDVEQYLANSKSMSSIYEDYYVDAREVQLNFPEQKRNLIYIFLESMETTYADVEHGGAATEANYIPELTEFAGEGFDFSGEDALNGFYMVPGADFTAGAMVCHTSGVPINIGVMDVEIFNTTQEEAVEILPGAWTLGDILDAAGYQQELLVGSDARFGGRSSYFTEHGNYRVSDYFTAVQKGRIPEDYYVWWGYEDAKLWDYAKSDILEMAENNMPFNMTILTVDTHFIGGFVCPNCVGLYENQYSNVMHCASEQVGAFLQWAKAQKFYENTTIVIAGDHLTMDSAYADYLTDGNYERRGYFTIINPAFEVDDPEQKRDYTTLDLFPTTLAALGVHIPGERLGLGVNLYGNTPTILEEKGMEYLENQLQMQSYVYNDEIMR